MPRSITPSLNDDPPDIPSGAAPDVRPLRRGDASRRRLLDCASALLVEGNGAFEIAAFAARAEISVGLAYHHFGSKSGLVAAVVEDFYDRYEAVAMDVNPLPGAAWPERERERVVRVVDFHTREPLAAIVLARLGREPEVAAVEARRLARIVAVGTANVRAAQKAGTIPAGLDAGLLVAMMMGGLHQLLAEALARNPRPPRERLVKEIWGHIAALARLPASANRKPTPHRRPVK